MLLSANRVKEMISFITKALGSTPSSSYSLKVINQTGQDFRTASAAELTALAEKQQIIGKGTEANLKYAILTVDPMEAHMTIQEANSPLPRRKFQLAVPIAADNFTVKRVNEPTGQYFEHRDEVCAAYRRV